MMTKPLPDGTRLKRKHRRHMGNLDYFSAVAPDGFLGKDYAVLPGEVGVIETRRWTAKDDESKTEQSCQYVVFPRGRYATVDRLDLSEWHILKPIKVEGDV